jgi:hypothetical protein
VRLSTACLPISENRHLVSFQAFLEILTQLAENLFLGGTGSEDLVEEVSRWERRGAKFLRGYRGDEGGKGAGRADTQEYL